MPSGTTQTAGLAQLTELFGCLPADLIADVFAACGQDADAATEALLGMASGAVDGTGSSSDATATAVPAPAPAGPCHWDLLPRECRDLVFQRLSLRELAAAARTCREWAAHVRGQRQGLRAVHVPRDVTHTALRGMVAAFASASEVDLSRWRDQLKFPHSFRSAFTAIALGAGDRATRVPVSRLVLAKCSSLMDGDVACLLDTLPHLRGLDLSGCLQLSDAAMSTLARYSRQPTEGTEGEQNCAEESGASEALARLALGTGAGSGTSCPSGDASAAGMSASGASGLESPNTAVRRIAAQLRSQQVAAAEVVAAAAATAEGLTDLVLRGAGITAKGVRALLAAGSATARSLEMLDVSRCPKLGGDALDVPPRAVLRVLRADGCNALRSVVIQLPVSSPLEELSLNECRQLQEVLVVAPRLRRLSVSHCCVLRVLGLRCRRLEQLHAVNCTALNLGAGGVLFDCPRLQELNLFGCRTLNAEGMESAAGSLKAVAVLDLTGCISLSRLLLPEAPALLRLLVSGCSVLRVVSAAAPQLAELRAKSCTRLMEVRLFTSVLRVLDLENCENVREVALFNVPQLVGGAAAASSPSPAPAPAAPAAATVAAARPGRSGPGTQAQQVVLTGCPALPGETKQLLRAAVLRAA